MNDVSAHTLWPHLPDECGIEVRGLSKAYGGGLVLNELDFSLNRGETLAVIGPSGCGKSTLLYLLAGLKCPDAGTVRLGTCSAQKAQPGAGMVTMPQDSKSPDVAFILQDYGLFPWKTVAANLSLPLELRGVPAAERQTAMAAMLEELRLNGLEDRFPVQLSGGQRQRVAIGRALITRPDILLMDEPFSSLDALTREHLQALMLELWQRRKPTCVLVTHNVAEALFLGHHIMVLHDHNERSENPESPAQQALWLDNPCFGHTEGHPAYASLIRQIRDGLGGKDEESWKAEAANDSVQGEGS